ncbi:hypothetical protein HDU98_010170 [Podochytrium sp. JEL0797]|nr:hypothetical protein HDU98_010170 [Podochytrium sp. JEL0797]
MLHCCAALASATLEHARYAARQALHIAVEEADLDKGIAADAVRVVELLDQAVRAAKEAAVSAVDEEKEGLEADVAQLGREVVAVTHMFDKCGMREPVYSALLQHAVELLWYEGEVYKPLLCYLKVVRKVLEAKTSRDHLPHTQWKALMDLLASTLFCVDENHDLLTGENRLNLAHILFYLSITGQKEVHKRTTEILVQILAFVQHAGEITCLPPLLGAFNHLVLEEFVNFPNDISPILTDMVVCLVSLWNRSSSRDAFYQPGSHRSAILQLLRLYLFFNGLSCLNGRVSQSLPIPDASFPDIVSTIYQAATKELLSKRARLTCLSNPSHFLSALAASFSPSKPFLTLEHATEFTTLHDGDLNDRVLSTWTFIDLFSDSLYHSFCSNEFAEVDASSVSQTTPSEILQLLNTTTSTNHRNMILQTLSLLFKKLRLYSVGSFDASLFFEPLCGLMATDSENPWVYVCFSFLAPVITSCAAGLDWDRVFGHCVRRFESSPCEHAFALLVSLSTTHVTESCGPILNKFFTMNEFSKHPVHPSACRFVVETSLLGDTKSKKELKDLAAVVLDQSSKGVLAGINPALVCRTVLKLVCGTCFAPTPESSPTRNEFGSQPSHVFPTEPMIEEWRFSELKKSISLITLESYELVLGTDGHVPPPLHGSYGPEVKWIVQQVDNTLAALNHAVEGGSLSDVLYFMTVAKGLLDRAVMEMGEEVVEGVLLQLNKLLFQTVVPGLQDAVVGDGSGGGVTGWGSDVLANLRLLRDTFCTGYKDAIGDPERQRRMRASTVFASPIFAVALEDLQRVVSDWLKRIEAWVADSLVTPPADEFRVRDGDMGVSSEWFPGHLMYFSVLDEDVCFDVGRVWTRVLGWMTVEVVAGLIGLRGESAGGGEGLQLVVERLGKGGGLVELEGLMEVGARCTVEQINSLHYGIESCLGNLETKKNMWVWLDVLRSLKWCMGRMIELGDASHLGFLVRVMAFFSGELLRAQVVWQLYIEFGSLAHALLTHDKKHAFLTDDPEAAFFTTPKGQLLLPLSYLSLLCRHHLAPVRIYTANRIKPLLMDPLSNQYLSKKLSADTSGFKSVSRSLVSLVFTLEENMENPELFCLFLTYSTNKQLEFACRVTCGKGSDGVVAQEEVKQFLLNALEMLARYLADQAISFEDAIQRIEALPLKKCDWTCADLLSTFGGHFLSKFLLANDFTSIDEMCQYLDLTAGNLIRQGMTVLVPSIFSSPDAETAAYWCNTELGGDSELATLVGNQSRDVICEILIDFDPTTRTIDFTREPIMRAMYMRLYGHDEMSVPHNTTWGVLDLMTILLGYESVSALVPKGDLFAIILLLNERLERIHILPERDRTAKNSIGFLTVMAARSLDSPVVLQMVMSLAMKFLAADGPFLNKVVEAIVEGAEIVERFQAIAVAKVIYSVATHAERWGMKQSGGGGGANCFLKLLDSLVASLQRFGHIQTVSLVFVDIANPLFGGVFEKFGPLLAETSDFSKLVEEAIEYSVPGAEGAIVKFVYHCLETGKELAVLSKTIAFLNQVIVMKAGVADATQILATQCLAMVSGDMPESLELALEYNPQQSVMYLLTSCLEDLNPCVVKEATVAISCISNINDGVFWKSCIKAQTPCWNTFEFFKENCPSPEVASVAKRERNLSTGLWESFDVSAVCENLVVSFTTDPLFTALHSMFKLVPKIAETVFPLLVHDILHTERKGRRGRVSDVAKTALSTCFARFFDHLEGQSYSANLCVVDTLAHLRMQLVANNANSTDGDFWLNVDYYNAAKAALKVKNHTLALLFYELWKCGQGAGEQGNRGMLIAIFKSLDRDGVDGVMRLMEPMDEKDSKPFDQRKELVKIMSQLMSSSLAESPLSLGSSSGVQNPSNGSSVPVSLLVRNSGFMQTKLTDLHYEALCRCGKWDMVPEDRHKDSGLNYFAFNARRSLDLSDVPSASRHLQDGFSHLSSSTDLMDVTNSSNIQSRLLPAVNLHELQTVAVLHDNFDTTTATRLFANWDRRLESLLLKIPFDDLESVISSRIVSLSSLLKSIPSPQSPAFALTHGYLSKTVVLYSKQTRKSANQQFSTIAMSLIKSLNDLPSCKSEISVKFEEFKVLFHQGNESMAIRNLKNTLDLASLRPTMTPVTSAKLYGKLAKWSDLQRSESPQSILAYFEKSAQFALSAVNTNQLNALPPADNLSSSFYHFASFADKTYTQMVGDESHEAMKSLVELRQLELNALNAKLKEKSDAATKTAIRRLNNQIQFDRAEIHRYAKEVEKFLIQSIENYFLCLKMGDKWDICVFSHMPKVNALVAKYIEILSASNRKFLPLIYQLCARMTTADDDFQTALKTLVMAMITSHPFHTVYQMIALKNGADADPTNTQTLNMAASDLLLRLQNTKPALRKIIQSANELCEAYIELAFLKPPTALRTPGPIDHNLKLAKIVDIPIPIVTVEHAVSLTCDYANLPTIQGFEKEYTLVGGINAPKVLNCYGSDGVVYKQLVKGGSDDLRQDATLSNVFSIMNVLLKKNFETRQRGLSIETYKVVPLGQRAGVIEWVDNTVPFGEYLGAAHAKYHKEDLSSMDARKKMMAEHERDDSSPQSKLSVYREIEDHFRPVFRHFFFESFRDPADWYKGRVAYTRSTAVTSIVGWIIGLGDRHPQNTLINQTTGSIIQIDLGIAFDQGKLLSTPELVPFRLTRDVVDAMGCTGIEGSFRRCCEETLRVARKEANIIYTILDVFRYDPLYNWKGGQSRNADGAHGGKNIEAERALVGVKKKMSDSLSIECQINELLLCAMNKGHLSKMFPGWQPWM